MTTIVNDKVIVGLGCSWTQGEGGYPEDLWKKYNGRINLPMHQSMHLIPIEQENSWVNVLSRDYLTNYTAINLGQRGIGNRGSARSLYLTNINWSSISDGIVVFMLSGFERYDFFRQDCNNPEFCGKSDIKPIGHYNFQTVWPHYDTTKLWKIYAKEVYSENAAIMEQMCNILEVQNFCKAHNLKFVFCNAFDDRGKDEIFQVCGSLADQIDWDCYLHNSTKYKNFAELLVDKDEWLPAYKKRNYFMEYQNLKWPKKYLTNCVHPTLDGYKVIADEIHNFIKLKYNI